MAGNPFDRLVRAVLGWEIEEDDDEPKAIRNGWPLRKVPIARVQWLENPSPAWWREIKPLPMPGYAWIEARKKKESR